MRTCSVDGCEGKHDAKGMCSVHYSRWKRLGTLDPPRVYMRVAPGEDYDAHTLRKLAAYSVDGPVFHDLGPCRDWTQSLNIGGYGEVHYRGRAKVAHLVAWEITNGPVPEGLELDHLCRRRHCIRVAHLEPVTRKVNWERGDLPAIFLAYARAQTRNYCACGEPVVGHGLCSVHYNRARHAAGRP